MPELKPIRLVLIDKNRIFRESLFNFLASEPDIICMACVSSVASFRSSHSPEVFLVHCGTAMLGQLQALANRYRTSRFVAIRVDVEQLDLVGCVRSGIDGFVLTDAGWSDVLSAIRCVGRGGKFLPQLAAEMLFSQMRSSALDLSLSPPIDITKLTTRERQIVNLILKGLSNKQIGHRLTIEPATVKTHVHSILQKLQIPTRTALISRTASDMRITSDRLGKAG
jgi:DNA-binding NarL/FixJ family response regulator